MSLQLRFTFNGSKFEKLFFSQMSCEVYFIKNKVRNKAVHSFKFSQLPGGEKSRLSTSKGSCIY